ncbi:MAG: hypothetical protein EAZ13_09510 [Sphingobacteriia bacterium]|nr:MAG: hypothetical protein EAZ13_09510 [Sphingobacteriia bacterium]
MNRLNHYFSLIAISIFALVACTKEISQEGTGLGGSAVGTLQDSLGNCKNIVVKGKYLVDTVLNDSNYLIVNVNFTTQGKYKISSDTVNGVSFIDSGFAFAVGQATVKLKGKGKPILPGTNNFIVSFGNSTCNFSVTTTTPLNNGGSAASFLCVKAGGYIDYTVTPPFDLVGGGTINNFRATIAAGTKSFIYKSQSNNYTEYSTDLNDRVYTRKDNQGKYYQYGSPEFEYFYFYDTIFQDKKMDFLYLDESKDVNISWETDTLRVGIDFDGAGINPMVYGAAKLKITILKKDQIASYFGVLYSDIIMVKRELYFTADKANAPTILPYYAIISYAKGIGMVDQQIFDISQPQTPQLIQSITIKGWRGL